MSKQANHKLSPVQQELLKIYKEVLRVCKKNDVKFFVTDGTALGAVRHQGFIPWDDDMDLGVPVDEYDKFCEVCKKDLKEPFEFINLLNSGGKIQNKSTAFIETQCLDYKEHGSGVFVDVFPIVGTPNNPVAREEFLLDVKKFHYKALVYDRYPEVSDYTKDEIVSWRNKLLYSNVIHDSENVIEFSGGFHFVKSGDGIKTVNWLKFEDTEVPVQGSIHEDLTAQFHDYMKLPPKEEQHSHSEYSLIDCKKSYLDYYERFEKIDSDLLKLLRAKHNLEGIFFDDLYDFLLKYEESQREIGRLNQELQKANASFDRRAFRYIKRKLKRS